MAIEAEKTIINACIIAELVWENSQFLAGSIDREFPFCYNQIFPILRKKNATVFSKRISELAKPHTVALIYVSVSLGTRWPQL